MWSLARRFLFFGMALGVLLGTAYVSFRCGKSQGLKDAPRHYYSVDVGRALRENPQFRQYVDSLYVRTYRDAIDSVLRTDPVVSVVADWLVAHPGCEIGSYRPNPSVTRKDFEGAFFR